MLLQESGGAIRTDKVALDVTGVGTATGAGTVSAAGALDYNVLLKLTGLVNSPAGGSAPAAASGGSAKGLGGLAGLAGGFIPGGAGGAAGALGSVGGLTSGLLKAGIPVAIGGTTSNPTFAPNLAGLTKGIGASAAQQFIGGKTGKGAVPTKPNANQLGNALGGLLGKH